MLIELFNDFCETKFYLKFETCPMRMLPDFSDNFETIKSKLNDINLYITRINSSKFQFYTILILSHIKMRNYFICFRQNFNAFDRNCSIEFDF